MPRSLLLAVLALAAVVPATAAAAGPARPKTMFEDHLHNTGGNDWHVQLQANDTGTRLSTIVLYAETCSEAGGLAARVPINPDGSFSVTDAKLEDGRGTWSVQGTFTDLDHATGTWSVNRGRCVIADHAFAAHDGRGHFFIGNPGGYAPARIDGSSKAARRLRILQRQTLANARHWNTVAKAQRLGYVPTIGEDTCPGIVHYRKHGVRMWGKVLDPSQPQALVYWCGADGQLSMVAAMYRAAGRTRPSTFGNIIQWHKHGATATWMTHVWLVSDPRKAWAACVPFPALEHVGLATYAFYTPDIPIDQPCPDTPGAEAPAPAPAG